jgi:hypothetical protein
MNTELTTGLTTESILALITAALIAALLVWWLIPIYIVDKFEHLVSDKERADVEDNYRKTIGQFSRKMPSAPASPDFTRSNKLPALSRPQTPKTSI